MRILDLYIGKILVSHVLVTVMVLLGLFTFVDFVGELGDIDKGGYGIIQVFQYVLLGIPKSLYEVFPIAALIGSILGLSVLARDSELVVMRAAGVSIQRIVFSVSKVGLILAFISMILGEVVSPYTETKAEQIRLNSIQSSIRQKDDRGVWMRDENTYVNIGEVLPNLTLLNIKIFEFDERNFLRFLSTAEEGEYQLDNKRWLLKGLRRTMIDDDSSAADAVNAAYWTTEVEPQILSLFRIEPEQLSLWQLDQYITHLESNKQDTGKYDLVFWSKIVTPFATIAMLVLAVPFVFKEARSGNLGRSLFFGIMIGLVFFIMNKAFGFFVSIFSIPPMLGAALPTILVCILAITMMRRIV